MEKAHTIAFGLDIKARNIEKAGRVRNRNTSKTLPLKANLFCAAQNIIYFKKDSSKVVKASTKFLKWNIYTTFK